MEYTTLTIDMINRDLFAHFIRQQIVTQCWRKCGDTWLIKDVAFIDDWDDADYDYLVTCLKNTVATGGVVFGVFADSALKAFASVEPDLFGKHREYMDLSSIHVSQDMRGNGIGKELFRLSKEWAKHHSAQKLYISAHSSVESQAFYKAMGCVEALEYDVRHITAEPYDCQLECVL